MKSVRNVVASRVAAIWNESTPVKLFKLKLLIFGLLATSNAWAGKPVTPAAPSNLSASAVSSTEIDLSWQDNSSNESGFKIERAPTSGGTWTQIATVGGGVLSYANT